MASGLAATVAGPDTGGTVVLYAGAERLDPQRRVLGEPPLVDGAVLALHTPVPDVLPGLEEGLGAPQLHVVAGPDAGGVHLLHPGAVRIGRSADADVPLDDPDVSRLHCAVTVTEDGRVSVADLNSTNGTALDGVPVTGTPVRLAPGALLRVGESTLRLAGPATLPLPLTPDLQGHLSLPAHPGTPAPEAPAAPDPARPAAGGSDGRGPHAPAYDPAPVWPVAGGGPATGPGGADPYPYSAGSSGAPDPYPAAAWPATGAPGSDGSDASDASDATYAESGAPAAARRRGIGAWARKWVGRDEEAEAAAGVPAATVVTGAEPGPDDPASLLLAALGPTGRLWGRGPGHPELLVVGLGAGAHVPLRTAGALGLAGPRARLTGLARSVVAQLAALHSPTTLEIVLIAADRARPLAERRADWGWLGWLPHTRPAHGQDCRLLLAYDRDQATARAGELTRRLDDSPLGTGWAAADRQGVAEAARAYDGPFTLVVVDGDPGPGQLRDVTGRLASHGPAAGIHVLALADAPAATPASPVEDTYRAACAGAPAFRDCGAVGLLSGDVATAVRNFRVSGGRPVPPGRRPSPTPCPPRGPSGSPAPWPRCAPTARSPSRSGPPPRACPRPRGCWTSWVWPGPPRLR